MKSLDKDTVSLLKKRVYDLAGCTPSSVNVYLNGKKLDKIKSFESYIDLYFKGQEDVKKYHEKVNPRWEVCVIPYDEFMQVSFVNSICTIRGGTHVNHVTDQICSKLMEIIKKKHKKLEIKPY